MTSKLIHTILSLLFPQKCLGCGSENTYLCEKCLEKIPYPDSDYYGILAGASYKSPLVQKAIWALKYRHAKILVKPLAELVYRRLKTKMKDIGEKPEDFIIIPVPLSKKRLRDRGFNQAELIAKHLSDIISVEFNNNVLYKIRDTISQVEIKDKEKRLRNLRGVFAIKNPELIKDKIIFLVDDVVTTGTTINEAKRVLLQAGAKKVIGLVVAKG